MNDELRKILGFYHAANVVEKQLTDYIWNTLYDELYMPVYERVVDQISKELTKLPQNERMTANDIIKQLELQKAMITFAAKMQKRVE